MMIELLEATPEDVVMVTRNLRESDALEVAVSTGLAAKDAVFRSASASDRLWVIKVEGEPVTLVGVVKAGPQLGRPWMVATPAIEEHAEPVARRLRLVLDMMYLEYPELANYAMLDNKLSVRFLEWLGFKFLGPVTDIGGHRFQLFVGER